MELSFTEEQEAFRHEVRAFIKRALPDDLAKMSAENAYFGPPEQQRWHRILAKQGWAAPNWPKEYGGAGLDPARRFILREEFTLAGVPDLSAFGIGMVGPLIIQYGRPCAK